MGDAADTHLTCTVCFAAFDGNQRRPWDIGCGHSFCEQCLRQHPRSFRHCPECRTRASNPHVNIALLRLVDAGGQQQQQQQHQQGAPAGPGEGCGNAHVLCNSVSCGCAAEGSLLRLVGAGWRQQQQQQQQRGAPAGPGEGCGNAHVLCNSVSCGCAAEGSLLRLVGAGWRQQQQQQAGAGALRLRLCCQPSSSTLCSDCALDAIVKERI
ncbi:hypothetical protein COO60DRAFT_335515 [Scenedesmus sp. NREL 46B-D3]|nr:hypothetical protein COO60DRAFT_335515 [Scenedesmus sp. NREL 46B-D3]